MYSKEHKENEVDKSRARAFKFEIVKIVASSLYGIFCTGNSLLLKQKSLKF